MRSHAISLYPTACLLAGMLTHAIGCASDTPDAPNAPAAIPAEARRDPLHRLAPPRDALRRITLGKESRHTLPAGVTSVPAVLEPGMGQLRLAVGIDRTAWTGPPAGSVVLSVTWRTGDERVALLERRLERKDAGLWHDLAIGIEEHLLGAGSLELSARPVAGALLEHGAVYWTPPLIDRTAAIDRRPSEKPNIILLSIDTLRADRLGCYGYERDTSPNIDRLARESVLFEHAIASSSWTLPSHASMLTGLNPSRHGSMRYGYDQPLDPHLDTLAERLWDRGYHTVGVAGGGFLNLGFDQGFDRYRTIVAIRDMVREVRAWLIDGRTEPFFLFLHTYVVHMPYIPPEPYTTMFDPEYDGPFKLRFMGTDLRGLGGPAALDDPTVEHLSALYDAGIRYMDAAVGELFDSLRQTALGERTCLIVTSDHGEEFREHGDVFHDKAKLFGEMVEVPLVIRCPAESGDRVIEEPVSLADITPTILDIAGAPVPPHLDGQSLLPVLRGAAAPQRMVVSEVDASVEGRTGVVRAVRSARHSLIVSTLDGSQRLFDLDRDPAETTDVSTVDADVVERLAAHLPRAPVDPGPSPATSHGQRGQRVPGARPDAATLEQLRALGYLDPSPTEQLNSPPKTPPGLPPQ